ncbi:MAG: hypothetical protein JSV90_06730 [Methanobacteriota archaeon]|nr:MAG: hypothetical protein JSV90_06730 [Euryarchaeota archaeon]
MNARDVWAVFTLLFVLAVAVFSAFMINSGEEPTIVASMATAAVAVYLYVVYKRYRVELVPEDDLKLFIDPEDLAILCDIYGLPSVGSPSRLMHRLALQSRAHADQHFIWVAPRLMRRIPSGLAVGPEEDFGEPPEDAHELVARMVSDNALGKRAAMPLVWGKRRSSVRLRRMTACPICDSEVTHRSLVCERCGADLEFYDALAESRIGHRLVAEKGGVRGKH